MKPTDLQIGDTFTELDYRGKGFAERTLRDIVRRLSKPGVTLWYVVAEENAASIRVAEKCGFELLGRGNRVKRLGLRILGSYVMDEAEKP
jgi:RimJ/RimL family protein N-acetyltransferase